MRGFFLRTQRKRLIAHGENKNEREHNSTKANRSLTNRITTYERAACDMRPHAIRQASVDLFLSARPLRLALTAKRAHFRAPVSEARRMNMTPRSGVSQLIAQRRALAAALVDATTADNPEQVLLTLAEVLAIVRMGETAWRRGVKDGLYPKPVVFSKRKIFWRAVDIDALLQRGNLAADEEKKPAKRARR